MTQIKKICASLILALSVAPAFAGGLLTNTNQNVAFLRNPARDAAIGIDGVYSNPAGVVFLGEGFHASFNWQGAWQTRTVNTTNPLFALGINNNGATSKEYEGKASAPVIPSFQLAYNKGRWSYQFAFAVNGGGGKCEFANGLGSFEGAVAQIGKGLAPFGAEGYDADYYMQGKQYYFGFTLGAAYKVNDNLSLYGGVRALYGTANYKARISDIMVKTKDATVKFSDFLDATNAFVTNSLTAINDGLPKINEGIDNLAPYKDVPGYKDQYDALVAQKAQLEGQKAQLEAAGPQLNALEVYRNGVNLQDDQTGFGVAPIIGVDYKTGNFNFAAKYEFATQMSMKNKSTLEKAMAIEAVNQFLDGTEVREDTPALLTVGAQWAPIEPLRINAGYHLYFDKQAQKYGNKQDLLSRNTMEYLGGVEYDLNDKLTISAGAQLTRYGMTDEYMSDLSFVTNSYSYGFGCRYQFTEKVALNVAYFQTNYDTYKTATDPTTKVSNAFTRTNRVLGVGVDIKL